MNTAANMIAGTVFVVIAALLPSLLFAIVGWKMSRKIQIDHLRIVIRAGVLSIAFTPTIYGHAGLLFASWVIILGHGYGRIIFGLTPILVTWIIGGIAALGILHSKKKKMISIK